MQYMDFKKFEVVRHLADEDAVITTLQACLI